MTKRLILRNLLLFVYFIVPVFQLASQPVPGTGAMLSPKVSSDSKITFTLNAPNAREVKLIFGASGDSVPLTKNEKGIWSVTVGPVKSELYTYALTVDGLRIVDPLNPELQGGTAPGFNLVNVPGTPPRFDELWDVSHGTVQIKTYYSTVQKKTRKLYVYLPPSYNQDDGNKFPVLYLRHGGGGNETSWYNEGCATIIMDNLLSLGKVKPMVIVMTNGNVETGAQGGYSAEAINLITDELMKDVIPLVEKDFRVFTDEKNRAVAGLSMGGGQSFYIGLKNPEKFDYLGTFSSGIFGGIPGASFDAEKAIPGLLTNSAFFNKNLKLFYLSVGEQDPRFEPTNKVVSQFRQSNLNVEYVTLPGVYEWLVWRLSLNDFLPRLFR